MKLYRIEQAGNVFLVLAWSFGEALQKWRGHSPAYEKADPDSCAVAAADIIGVPKRKTESLPSEPPRTLEPASLGVDTLGLVPQKQGGPAM